MGRFDMEHEYIFRRMDLNVFEMDTRIRNSNIYYDVRDIPAYWIKFNELQRVRNCLLSRFGEWDEWNTRSYRLFDGKLVVGYYRWE